MNYLRILDKNDNIIDHIMIDDNLFDWQQISESAQSNKPVEYGKMYDFIYNTDFYEYISDKLKKYIKEKYDIDNFKINIISKEDYKQYDEKFAHECNFIDYINSELATIDKITEIDEDILEVNKFENKTTSIEKDYWENQGIKDFSTWRRDTHDIDGEQYIIIDFNKGITNNNATWGVHIDNNICESIGSIDLSNVWQFNMFMEILGSKFRLES